MTTTISVDLPEVANPRQLGKLLQKTEAALAQNRLPASRRAVHPRRPADQIPTRRRLGLPGSQQGLTRETRCKPTGLKK